MSSHRPCGLEQVLADPDSARSATSFGHKGVTVTAAPALPLLDRRLNRPAVLGVSDPDCTAGVREVRRAGNLEGSGVVDRLRCECALPSCRKTFPAVAESYRGTAERFIVVPAHLGAILTRADTNDGTVVRAADLFFVVELTGTAGRFPAPAGPRLRIEADRTRLHPASWSSTISRPWLEA